MHNKHQLDDTDFNDHTRSLKLGHILTTTTNCLLYLIKMFDLYEAAPNKILRLKEKRRK